MTSRERVLKMFEGGRLDKPVLECYVTQCGLYEHREKLVELYKGCPDDFNLNPDYTIPAPPASDFDADGSYNVFETDKWGAVWQKRIFGIMGHPVEYPLEDMSKLNGYQMPKNWCDEVDVEAFRAYIAEGKKKVFVRGGGVQIFEVMHTLRRFEDVLMDIYEDTDEINRLADMLCEYHARDIDFLIKEGVDGISFGDDFGMAGGLIMGADVWRRFFKERYRKLMKPIRDNGMKVFFHSCGNVSEILPDLTEVGITSIWTQLSAYSMSDLARQCRELGIAATLHIDRAKIMTCGTPEDVRNGLREIIDVFVPQNGGSWLYVEVDNGFPFENVQALFEEIQRVRK